VRSVVFRHDDHVTETLLVGDEATLDDFGHEWLRSELWAMEHFHGIARRVREMN
jgi:hypothetical protein